MRARRTSTAALAGFLSQAKARHAGFTLVELLVAATIALVVMGAVASLLGVFSRTSSSLQSLVDMTARMRVVGNQLRSDLAGVTCDLRPPISPESDSGYFELIEGPMQDAITYDSTTGKEYAKPYLTGTPYLPAERLNSGTNGRLLGDVDDVLALTTRSLAAPFTGRCFLLASDSTTAIQTTSGSTNFYTLQSRAAEVAWFLQKSVNQVQGYDVFDLYRRQLLVLPYVGVSPFVPPAGSSPPPGAVSCDVTSGTSILPTGKIGTIFSGINQVNIAPWTAQTWTDYFGGLNSNGLRFYYDVSVRRVAVGANNSLVPNSLGDLTKRENRFWRWTFPSTNYLPIFPYPFLWDDNAPSPGFNRKIDPKTGFPFVQETARQGEDVVLKNVISFDLRVFDPDAPIIRHLLVGAPLAPGDPGYLSSGTNAVSTGARGAYVDLNWGVGVTGTTSLIYDIAPAARTRTYDNVFPGSEDTNKNGMLDMTPNEDLNGNGVLDIYTAFQNSGMQVANVNANAIYSTLRYPAMNALNHAYDTWSTHYESNGIDDDSDGLIDEGNNGDDDNSDGIPDDPAERETSPPYPVPLRGIEVRIRCIEPTTKEIRQITIRHAFNQN